jgi:hypothetical protein
VFGAPREDGAIRQLTRPGTVNGEPCAAGGWVVFRSNRSGGGDLYAVRADADNGRETGLAWITRTGERDTHPSS